VPPVRAVCDDERGANASGGIHSEVVPEQDSDPCPRCQPDQTNP
jgi:hypothetical protein